MENGVPRVQKEHGQRDVKMDYECNDSLIISFVLNFLGNRRKKSDSLNQTQTRMKKMGSNDISIYHCQTRETFETDCRLNCNDLRLSFIEI